MNSENPIHFKTKKGTGYFFGRKKTVCTRGQFIQKKKKGGLKMGPGTIYMKKKKGGLKMGPGTIYISIYQGKKMLTFIHYIWTIFRSFVIFSIE